MPCNPLKQLEWKAIPGAYRLEVGTGYAIIKELTAGDTTMYVPELDFTPSYTHYVMLYEGAKSSLS